MTMQSAFAKILERSRCTASSERGPQTGDRGRVSNTGLIFYLNNTQRAIEFLEKIIFFVVPTSLPRGELSRGYD